MKCESSSNPRLNAISEIFQLVCLSNALASCETRSAMSCDVVLPVTSFRLRGGQVGQQIRP